MWNVCYIKPAIKTSVWIVMGIMTIYQIIIKPFYYTLAIYVCIYEGAHVKLIRVHEAR